MTAQRTTTAAGALLLAAVLLHLLVSSRASVAVTDRFVVPLSGDAVGAGAGVLLLAGFIVLARGLRGPGIAGSRVGAAALVVLGAGDLALRLVALLSLTSQTGGGPVLLLIGTGVPLVGTAAAIVAAVSVVRARRVTGYARWSLVPLAVLAGLLATLNLAARFTPVGFLAHPELWVPLFEGLAWLRLAALAAAGVGFVLASRTASLRARARDLEARW